MEIVGNSCGNKPLEIVAFNKPLEIVAFTFIISLAINCMEFRICYNESLNICQLNKRIQLKDCSV